MKMMSATCAFQNWLEWYLEHFSSKLLECLEQISLKINKKSFFHQYYSFFIVIHARFFQRKEDAGGGGGVIISAVKQYT